MSKVIMTVGCPGSGKTTFSRTLDPTKWVSLSLDDFRTMLFGGKKVYWELVDENPQMRDVLHSSYRYALVACLKKNQNVCLANTHVHPSTFRSDIEIIGRYTTDVTYRVYLTSLPELLKRNSLRDSEERVPEDYLRSYYAMMHADDAWWKDSTIMNRVELVY